MKSKIEIYALAVCFSCIVCLVISLSIGGYALFEIGKPEITMNSYHFEKYQSNDNYWDDVKKRDEVRPSDEVLEKKRMADFEVALKSESRSGIQTLLRSLVFIFTSSIVLFIHRRIIVHIQKSA